MEKIVIFGATGAIGSTTARLLAAKGESLHFVGRDGAKLEAIADELGASSTQGDVLDEKLFARVAEDAAEAVSGLVYAVGTRYYKPKITSSVGFVDSFPSGRSLNVSCVSDPFLNVGLARSHGIY